MHTVVASILYLLYLSGVAVGLKMKGSAKRHYNQASHPMVPLGNASLHTGDSSERFLSEEMRGYDYEKPLINNAGGYACKVNDIILLYNKVGAPIYGVCAEKCATTDTCPPTGPWYSVECMPSGRCYIKCRSNKDCQMGASCMYVPGVGQYACLYLAQLCPCFEIA
ncbi:hypothetical protein FOL46_001596 [Perkinsus olseni]|nr:hypothetical protein FOL46_001596 [Perkinsus olseni]